MMAPAAMPPITPAAIPQPRQRASAVVGAATDAIATALPAARTVKNLVMDGSEVGPGHQRYTANPGSRAAKRRRSSARELLAFFAKFTGRPGERQGSRASRRESSLG